MPNLRVADALQTSLAVKWLISALLRVSLLALRAPLERHRQTARRWRRQSAADAGTGGQRMRGDLGWSEAEQVSEVSQGAAT